MKEIENLRKRENKKTHDIIIQTNVSYADGIMKMKGFRI